MYLIAKEGLNIKKINDINVYPEYKEIYNKSLPDKLIIGIISDADCKDYKREPIINETDRCEIIKSIKKDRIALINLSRIQDIVDKKKLPLSSKINLSNLQKKLTHPPAKPAMQSYHYKTLANVLHRSSKTTKFDQEN